jgi:hypothetical protein
MATDTASARYQDQPRPGAGDRPGGHAGVTADTQAVRYNSAETGDRVGYSAADLDGLRSMARAGEWRELVDLLVASLGSTGAPVTAAEHGELRSLLGAMDLPDAALGALTVEG